ncbi:MAG: DUF4230 domain-containing protein [Pirellulaceae bacterium]
MKTLAAVLAGLATFGLTLGLVAAGRLLPSYRLLNKPPSQPTVTDVQSLGQLIVLKVGVADVLELREHGYEGVWIIRGDGVWSVDLMEAEMVLKEDGTRCLFLPRPRVEQYRVDMDRSLTFDVRFTNWVPWTGDREDFNDLAMREAQSLIQLACSTESLELQAKENAELLLKGLATAWSENLYIVWRD